MIRMIPALMMVLWMGVVVAASSPGEVLEAFLASARTLSADFVQQSIDETGHVSQQSRGRFYLKRPGKFRWTYQSPYRQEIVADGDKVWFYDPDLEQVTVKTVDSALGSAPALLLSGQLKLSQRFEIEDQGREGKRLWLKLKPKDEEDVFRYLRVEMEGGRLVSMELADHFGQLTRIRFSAMEINLPLDDDLFTFTPPPGVDVFEG